MNQRVIRRLPRPDSSWRIRIGLHWICLVWLLLAGMQSPAWAGCSSYAGKFTINELNLINTNTGNDIDPGNDTARPFVELKVLDQEIIDQIAAGSWTFAAGWKVTSIVANGSQFVKDLPAIFSGAPGSNTNNICQSSTSVYIRVPFENNELQDTDNVVLSDPSGAIVDILRVSKDASVSSYYAFTSNAGPYPTASNQYPAPACSTCNASSCSAAGQLPFDSDFNNFASGGQASKDIQRLPDGTGSWTEAPGGGSNTQQTLCTTNDSVLLVTKTPDAYSVAPGSNVTYTMTLKGSANYAAGSANTTVLVSEPLPAGLSYVLHAAPTHGNAVYNAGSKTVDWTIASLAAGVTASMAVTATVVANGAITNTVTATSTELAPGYTQASATLNALKILVVPDSPTVALNGNVTYTITLTNDSATTLTSVAASALLPAGLTFVSAGTPTAGAFDSTTKKWTNIGSLQPGFSATLTITAAATQTGTITYPVSATTTRYPGVFVGSGSILVGNPGTFQVTVPDFKAGDGTATPATVGALDGAGNPQPGFANAVRKVKFYYQGITPASGAAGTMKMDAYEAAGNTVVSVGGVATTLPAAVTRDVYFDANGVGRFDINYDNVGAFSLYAEWKPSFEASPPGGAPIAMSGNDSFIVMPDRYDVVPSLTAAAGGGAFDVTVTAQALCGKADWGYPCPAGKSHTTATNFAGAAADAVTLKVDPAGLTNAPALWCANVSATCPNDETTPPIVPAAAFVGGVASLTEVHWSEVGSAVLKAEATYLGSAGSSNPGGSVGFHPARFAASGSVSSDAGSFLYYGQPALDIAQTIAAEVLRPDGTFRTAQNYAAATYSGTLATVSSLSQSSPGGTPVDVCADSTCAAALTNPAAGTGSCVWTVGICQLLQTDALFVRAATPALPQTVAFSVQVSDGENKVAACVKSSLPATCSAVSPYVYTADYGAIDLRYGRIRLQNAFGSEKLPLEVPVGAQYWTANGWVTNSADNTTQLLTTASNAGVPAAAYAPAPFGANTASAACYGACASATAATPATTAAEWADVAGTLLVGNVTSPGGTASPLLATSSVPTFPAQAPDSTTLSSGTLKLRMGAPLTRSGSFDLTLVVPPWLQIASSHPKAKLAFGLYKGSDRFIYRREVR